MNFLIASLRLSCYPSRLLHAERAIVKKDWQQQKSYRMSRGRLIGTLRTQWLADINWDRRQPAAPTYPLINWTGEKR